jgi:carbon monoxide dehydrogenase subunit G
MEITSNARIDAPLDVVWGLLSDIPRVSRCLPGTEITEIVDERTYKAIVNVKVGPLSVSYKATIALKSLDAEAHASRFTVDAVDVKGRGYATAIVSNSAQADGDGTAISVVADAKVSGVIAQFGQGVMKDVAGRIMQQFALNVGNEVKGLRPETQQSAKLDAGAVVAGVVGDKLKGVFGGNR